MNIEDKYKLFNDNIPLAKSLAKRLSTTARKSGLSYDDALQDALIGLWKAVEKFDTSRGKEFGALAVPKINGEIIEGFRRFTHSRRKVPSVRAKGAPEKGMSDIDMNAFSTEDPVEQANTSIIQDDVRKIIDSLPASSRRVLKCRVDNISLKVEAQKLNLHEDSLYRYTKQAMDHFRKKWQIEMTKNYRMRDV